MKRIQVQLTPEQERVLREMARLRGASISALIREGIDDFIGPQRRLAEERRKRAMELIGILGPGGPSDVSRNHDRYFADAIHDRLHPRRK
jgi:hypothetical protein